MSQQFERSAGILLPVSALPSPYGIGTLGREAYQFVDFVAGAGQRYWQVLPLGPTSYGDSPYQSFSAFAGSPYYIDLSLLIEEGLLKKEYVESFSWGEAEDTVDYALLFQTRLQVLENAYETFRKKGGALEKELKAFCENAGAWLTEYALFMACKEHFNYRPWTEWEDAIRLRKAEALARYTTLLQDRIDFYQFCQFLFFQQWNALKQYANKKGVELIGDIPIYVAGDSADVWAHPEVFQLNENLVLEKVAGVPPDAFTELGQKWGNPLYDWDALAKTDFEWWKQRMRAQAELFDVIRIDHFLGILKYYSIPAQNPDAKQGEYRVGPGEKLTDAINEAIGDKKIIAEDLGVDMPEATALLQKNGYPGMKVLEFAFDGNPHNPHLPHNYSNHLVVYGGTHDNETLYGYYTEHSLKELEYACAYLGTSVPEKMVQESFRVVYASVADVVIFQMQDVLCLDNRARINFPSTLGGNWQWRMKKDALRPEYQEWLLHMTQIYGRAANKRSDMED